MREERGEEEEDEGSTEDRWEETLEEKEKTGGWQRKMKHMLKSVRYFCRWRSFLYMLTIAVPTAKMLMLIIQLFFSCLI